MSQPTDPDDSLLTTTEGVDEGSADSTDEGLAGGGPAPAPESADDGLIGSAPRDASPADEADTAPPAAVETPESAAAQGRDTGQQLSAGEG